MRAKTFLLLFFPLTGHATHCVIDAQPVSFGSYDIFSPAPLDAVSYVNVQCSTNDPFRITIDSGINGDGSFVFRRLQGGDNVTSLNYNLYLDVSRRQVWGDGSGGSLFYTGTPQAGGGQIPIYGRIQPGQRVATGFYQDSVMVTVEW